MNSTTHGDSLDWSCAAATIVDRVNRIGDSELACAVSWASTRTTPDLHRLMNTTRSQMDRERKAYLRSIIGRITAHSRWEHLTAHEPGRHPSGICVDAATKAALTETLAPATTTAQQRSLLRSVYDDMVVIIDAARAEPDLVPYVEAFAPQWQGSAQDLLGCARDLRARR